MHINADIVAYAACAQVVRFAYHGFFFGQAFNVGLGVFGQAFLQQFAYGLAQQGIGCAHDEDAYCGGGHRVEHRPVGAEGYGATYAYGGAY